MTSIAYDPETYIVQYGTASDSLTSTSSTVSSGNAITRTNFMLSVELTGLTRDTLYYYQVVATNTAGSTTSAAPGIFANGLCNFVYFKIYYNYLKSFELHL